MSWTTIDGWALLVALARVAPAMLIPLRASGLPVRRSALGIVAVIIAAVVAGGLGAAGSALADADALTRIAWLLRDAGVGAVLGTVAAAPVAALATAAGWGRMMSGEWGGFRPWFTLLGGLVFLALHGHLTMATAVANSYRELPALASTGLTAGAVVRAGSTLFGLGLAMAMPMLGAAALTALAVGLVERLAIAPAGAVPELALRRLAMGLALAAGTFAIARVAAHAVSELPARLAAVLAG